ncbi:MAG: surface layer protein B [Planctomycetes bacterium]|nr:surface layer protein B [Planctomycetota bacterium]
MAAFFLLLLILFSGAGSELIAQETLKIAPRNPAFVSHLVKIQSAPAGSPAGNYTGFLPSPRDKSYLQEQGIKYQILGLGFSPSYDLRDYAKLTPVRDQGAYSTCWTFGAYGSMESCLLPGESRNFSENNMANLHGYDWGYDYGGNLEMAMAYLARWSGPVEETADPYPNPGGSPTGLPVQKHTQRIIILPDRASASDNDAIKEAIETYGAIFSSMYWSSSRYNSSTYGYYYSGTAYSNHAITIVGWDDNYSKSNFIPRRPSGDGAFIVRNSWGPSWGEGGYFYISYEDTRIGTTNGVFSGVEPADNYTSIYQYDPLGWVDSVGYIDPTAWGANIFTVANEDDLAAVSFYTASPGSSYEIYIYTGCSAGDPISGTLALSQAGVTEYPGYYTIPLASPVALSPGVRFSVVVKFVTPGYNYPVPIEWPIAGYSTAAAAGAGESFFSYDGLDWLDAVSELDNCNICIKAFAGFKPVAVASFTLQGGQEVYFHASDSYDPDGSEIVAWEWLLAGNPFSDQQDFTHTFPGYAYDPAFGITGAMAPYEITLRVQDAQGAWSEAEALTIDWLPGDVDGNDLIDLADFFILKTYYGTFYSAANIDNLEKVDFADFVIMRTHYGTTR